MSHKIGIIGASGYTGSELLRIIAGHPGMVVEIATGDSQAGNKVGEAYPHLAVDYPKLEFQKFDDIKSDLKSLDLVFLALPHGEAMKIISQIDCPKIIDLGSDFRLQNPDTYKEWYGNEHVAVNQLGSWQYGMTELFREEIARSSRIANPGCYPTAAVLALAPLVKSGVLEGTIIVDAYSGTSGAGKGLSAGLHFSHAFEDVRAYKIAKHQHTPEIEMALSRFSTKNILVSFTPHLLPTVRGIHATSSAQIKAGVSQSDLFEILNSAYSNDRFISVIANPVSTKEVRGSNLVRISPHLDKRTGRAIIVSVIDNLVKGASGQAVQNANLILGYEEVSGLNLVPLYP